MNIDDIPRPTVKRLSLYLRQLKQLQKDRVKTISSRELARLLDTSDAQVRKDFAYFGAFGKRGVGYHVDELTWNISDIMQLNITRKVIIIGAGALGCALANYKEFKNKGFIISAIFDSDQSKEGLQCGKLRVENIKNMRKYLKSEEISIAIIAVPAGSAQDVADAVVEAGIKHVLSFSPVSINVPGTVQLRSVDLSLELEQLSFGM